MLVRMYVPMELLSSILLHRLALCLNQYIKYVYIIHIIEVNVKCATVKYGLGLVCHEVKFGKHCSM